MGLLYIKNWSPVFIPLLSLISGLVSIYGFFYIGELIRINLKLEIEKYWEIIVNLILGIFVFSLLVQLISIIRLNNNFSFSLLFISLFLLGIKKIFENNFQIPKLNKNSFLPAVILIAIFLIRIFVSIIPTTKIDELHYHMLLPLRLISETGLNYYSLPWESAIWPHMHYQFIGGPFYAIGLPDTLNIISTLIFISFLKTLFDLINNHINNKEITLWCLVLISSGLHSLIDLPTNASNSLMLVCGASSLLILCDFEKYTPSKSLKSFSLIFGILTLGLIASKVSMLPISIIQIFLFLRTIKTKWGGKLIRKSFFYFLIPFLVFYAPLLTYTWIKSGSPFGPLLSSIFFNQIDADPLVKLATGEIGNKYSFNFFAFLALTKWTPFIWISILFTAHKKIKLKTKLIFLIILIIQSILFFIFLPNSPRYFGGIQYVGILIIFIELIPEFFRKFKKLFLSLFLFSSIPWLLLDIYYSYPLLSKAFLKHEVFKKDYIPFYKDFLILDNLLENNAQILVVGTRINTFHSPREIIHFNKNFTYTNQIKIREKPTYLFLVGEENVSSLKLGKLIYTNNNSNQYCYRVPNKPCQKERLKVFKIEN